MSRALARQRLHFIALPVEPHHLLLGEVRIPLLGRINHGEFEAVQRQRAYSHGKAA